MYENIKYYKDIQYRYWKYIDIWVHEIKTNKLSYCQKILVYHQENAIYLWHHYCSTSTVEGSFCGYGVAVSDFKNLVIKWSINDTYIQKMELIRILEFMMIQTVFQSILSNLK